MIRVRYLPYQAHCFAFGGFELHTLSALASLRQFPVDASMQDLWSRDDSFDVLHCWGLGLPHFENVRWAKRSGKRVVITALVSYLENIRQKAWFLARRFAGEERFNRILARSADAIVVLNELQADVLNGAYGVSADRIRIIPNVVKEDFYTISAEAFLAAYGMTGFVLCTGNICKRKNQLNLLTACAQSGLQAVIIGGMLKGEESYGESVLAMCRDNPGFRWISEVSNDSRLLASAYHACAAFALPSYREQQPISALEAAAAQKPVLLSDRAYARQEFYANAALVNPDSVASIRRGLEAVFKSPSKFIPPAEVVAKCHEANIGKAYFDVYRLALEGSPASNA